MTMTQEQAEKVVDALADAVRGDAADWELGGGSKKTKAEVAQTRDALIAALTAGPGVPDKIPMTTLVFLNEDDMMPEQNGYKRGWNACVDYMLAAAPPAPVVSVADAVAAGSDDETAALVSLVRSGIRTDIQELLIYGSKQAQVPPGALRKAIDAVFKARGQGGAM